MLSFPAKPHFVQRALITSISGMDTVNDSPILETNRLQLRLFEQSDVERLYRLYSDPEVMRHMRGTRDRKQAEEHIRAFAQQYMDVLYHRLERGEWLAANLNDAEPLGKNQHSSVRCLRTKRRR